jgi:tryptophan 6-halogenase
MGTPARSILIVGGGTAGWTAAAALARRLGGEAQVTLVESRETRPIAVGEASLSVMQDFFAYLGIPEEDWMPRCEATYKLGIRFVDWTAQAWDFPFYSASDEERLSRLGAPLDALSRFFLARRRDEPSFPSFDRCFLLSHLFDALDARECPAVLADGESLKYGYHFDTLRLGECLGQWSRDHGVRHLYDDVVGVHQDEAGHLRSVTTRSSGELMADLFVDCTGFASLLLGQALAEPFIPFTGSLLCDAAVVLSVPLAGPEERLSPFTTVTALSSGWSWHIPLRHRHAHGYVYSSAFLSPAQAEEELRRHLAALYAGRGCGREARHLRFKTGRRRNAWVANCAGVGLSSGFIEPLEATAIGLIQYGAVALAEAVASGATPERIAAYNATLSRLYTGVLSFVTLHYCTAAREDSPFWRRNRNELELPPELQTYLGEWRRRGEITSFESGFVFGRWSWHCILNGMGCLPEERAREAAEIEAGAVERLLASTQERAALYRAALHVDDRRQHRA